LFASGRNPVFSPSEGQDKTPILVYQAVAQPASAPWMLKLIELYTGVCSKKGRLRATQLTILLLRAVAHPALFGPVEPVMAPGGEEQVRALVVGEGEADLLHVVRALDAAGGLAGRLHRRQQQRDQDGDDGDDDQQLDERETAT